MQSLECYKRFNDEIFILNSYIDIKDGIISQFNLSILNSWHIRDQIDCTLDAEMIRVCE